MTSLFSGTLADQLRVCLQESSDEIPRDFTTLFDRTLFQIDTSVVYTLTPLL